jgi:hypothetical protein
MINIWIRTLDQHLSFGIECLALSIRGRETSVWHYNPINSYNPITLNFHIWKDIISDVMKSRSLKEAYALMFTNPSKLEAVKAKLYSTKEHEQVNETNIDFTQINNIEK